MPDFPAINSDIQKAIGPTPAPASSLPPWLIQALMGGLQATDAVQTAKNIGHGAHEYNPMMAPFSHGGAPMMMGGFALGDLVRHALLRHASQGTRNTADGAQALMNALGIMQTNHNLGNIMRTPPLINPKPGPTP